MQAKMNHQNSSPYGWSGQGLVEYALILSLVSIVSLIALSALGGGVSGVFEQIVCSMRGGDNCDQRGGVCGDEQITEVLFLCTSPTSFTLAVTTTCDGAELSLDGYGGMNYNSGTDEYVLSIPSLTGGECTGNFGSRPSGTFTIFSLHPDDNYLSHSSG